MNPVASFRFRSPRFRPPLLSLLTYFAASVVGSASLPAAPQTVVFNQPVSSHEWPLKELNPELPSDWTGYDFLVLEFRSSSSQRFELGVKTAHEHVSKRIHPFAGVWVRASIPLRFYRQGLGNAHDLAATVNQPRNSYWINIESGGHAPMVDVQAMTLVMRYPVGSPKLEIRSVTLAKTDPGDAVLEGGTPLIDEFGQYIHADWPGKAKSEEDLKAAWSAEAEALAKAGRFPGRDRFGGFTAAKTKATGFFRTEQIDGRWWFVTPEGHLFYSAGLNQVGTNSTTRSTGREEFFAKLPPPITPPPGVSPRGATALTNFYGANIQRRYGTDWRPGWAKLTAQRLEAWGLNTTYGTGLSEVLHNTPHNIPYVFQLRGLQPPPLIMGMPDVYSEKFVQHVETEAERQLTPRKDDPYVVGYFIGNEPPWPGRESEFVDMVLAGEATAMQAHFKAALAKGDTPEIRRDLVCAAFERYLAIVNATTKKYDPNHLNLGIRFGGTPPDYVVKLARGFDVYSLNKYRWTPPKDLLDNVHKLTGLPLLLGEFHIGVPGRGMAPGLVQAMNQEERGVAYRYYVENAAAHPAVMGTHWFQWIDQPATGRGDGENYNIGWVDVTDRPYAELVEAAKLTHARLLEIHAGKIPPTDRRAVASEVGTPADTMLFGRPGKQ
jgi:hypothetical protein